MEPPSKMLKNLASVSTDSRDGIQGRDAEDSRVDDVAEATMVQPGNRIRIIKK